MKTPSNGLLKKQIQQIACIAVIGLQTINFIITAILILIGAFFMLLIPSLRWRLLWSPLLEKIVSAAFMLRDTFLNKTTRIHWEIRLSEPLFKDHWYMLMCNHKSYADIPILQHVFSQNLPMLRFFMKRQLLWSLPLWGFICWALGFPMIRRYTKQGLKNNPKRKGQDLEIIRSACKVGKKRPSVFVNFPEGTRFTPQKRDRQRSPFKDLLKPKIGGCALVLNALDKKIDTLIDVTIVYPGRDKVTLWDYFTGKIQHIVVDIDLIPFDETLRERIQPNRSSRQQLNTWAVERWQRKQDIIDTYHV